MFSRPCARCGRLVVWDGRNGYAEVRGEGRRCGPWFVVRGHDPEPPQRGEGWVIATGVLLGFLALAVLLAIMFAL